MKKCTKLSTRRIVRILNDQKKTSPTGWWGNLTVRGFRAAQNRLRKSANIMLAAKGTKSYKRAERDHETE